MRRTATTDLTWIVLSVGLSLNGCHRTHREESLESSPQREQIALLRVAYDAFNRGDIDAAVESLAPDIEWSEPAEFPGGGTYHGREGAKSYLSQSRAAWAEVTSEPEQFIAAGNRIVVFVDARLRPLN